MQVRVRPRALMPVKLVTALVSIFIRPSMLNRLTTSTTSPVAGLTALTPSAEQMPEITTTASASTMNISMGSGILLPRISTLRRKRSNPFGFLFVSSMILLSFLFVRVPMSFAAKIRAVLRPCKEYNTLIRYVKRFLPFHPGFCTLSAFSGFIIPACYNHFKQIIHFLNNHLIVAQFIPSAFHLVFLISTPFSAKHPLLNL